MTIISVLNPKGGSGKTTLATNLARSFHERGKSILLVDSDPQGSARDWQAANEENPLAIIALDRAQNLKKLDTIAKPYDFVVIDGAAKLEDVLAATIKASDVVIIPVQPSPYDLWAASDLISFVKARQEITDGKPKAAFVITRAISGTTLGADVKTTLAENELPVFDTHVTQRQTYPQTASEGLTVFDGKNSDAIKEIQGITDEIMNLIGKGA